MRTQRLIGAIVLGLGLSLALLWLLNGPPATFADSGTRYVATTGYDDSNDCTNTSNPCRTVQYAVDQAASGDTILVASGVYTGVHVRSRPPGYDALVALTTITQVAYISKTITIQGGYTSDFAAPPDPQANPTTLNAEGKGRVMVIAGYISPTIEGLRITRGDAARQQGEGGPHDAGGGVYVISATAALSNNLVFSNTAYSGGGLYLLYSDATLGGNAIVSNTGGAGGGGGLKLYYSHNATLRGNLVATNTAPSAGGLFLNVSDATLSGNIFVSNTAATGSGGGAYVLTSNAVISGNTFISNTADDSGGGLYVYASSATLVGNTVKANIAPSGLELYSSDATLIRNIVIANTAQDAALVLYYSDAALYENIVISNTAGCGVFLRRSNATLTNTVVADNRAATSEGCGLYIADGSLPHLVHTTIARNGGNQGTGVHVTAFSGNPVTATMTNTILTGHTWGVYVAPGDAATLESTLWYSNTVDRYGTGQIVTGIHNYWGDPRFAADGYHLMAGSTAIDRGVDAGVTTDIDGDSRPQGLAPDLGADERVSGPSYKIYLPVVLNNYP